MVNRTKRGVAVIGRAALVLLSVATLGACKRKHVPVEAVPELGYPGCPPHAADAAPDREEGELLAKARLRSGPTSVEKNVVETYEIRKTSCHYRFTGRQEWPLGTSDVEVVYDESLVPLRVWKRMTLPGTNRADGFADIRRYELRTPEVTLKRKTPDGEILFELLRPGGRTPVLPGAKPMAVIGPGRGVLSMWIRRTNLPVGGKVHELVLDFREMIEKLENATLAREADRFEPSLGRTVRVYTIYGRESVFTDDEGDVIGDLAGLRPSDTVPGPEPAPVPMFGEPDPVGTP